MSNQTTRYIQETLKAVPAEHKVGYQQALVDLITIASEVPVYGTYLDSELRILCRSLAEAQKVPVVADMMEV